MSLILEALRKSEAERRRGQTPDLYAELPPVARTQRQPMPLWVWLAIGVAAFALILWLLHALRQPAAPAVIATTASEVTSDDITPSTAMKVDTSRANPAPVYTPPIRDIEPTRNPAPDIAVAAAPPVVVPQPPVPAATPNAAAVVATPPIAEPEPLPAPSPEPIASNDGLLRLADLSADERKQLPPLKLSMHMWNDAPAQRFVIIDGHRLAEGDRIGDAVLEAIQADGVVLDWNGRRFKLRLR